MPTLRNACRFGAIAALVFVTMPAQAKDDPKIADAVMALARAQWAAEIAGAPAAQQMEGLADDYTEFNADYPTLIMGKKAAVAMNVAPDAKPVFSDMMNPHVQVYGDTAILTYNFAGLRRAADGKVAPSLAKSTRVYAKQGGRWMLVHANFAPLAAGH